MTDRDTAGLFPYVDSYKLGHEVTRLEEQNAHLRGQVEQLSKELYQMTLQASVKLPSAATCQNPYWHIPLFVGDNCALVADFNYNDPNICTSTTLPFKREWSNEGVFWRAMPFATRPEKVRR